MGATATVFNVTNTDTAATVIAINSLDIYAAFTSGSGAKIFYDDKSSGGTYYTVTSTPAQVSALALNMIAVTDTELAQVFYINADRVIDVITSGSGAKIYFRGPGVAPKVYTVTETRAAIISAIAAISISSGGAVTTGIEAHAGGGQADATQLAYGTNEVTVVATAGDSVKLPAAVTGANVIVKNDGANTLDLYPATGDTIDDGSANAAIQVPPGVTVQLTGINTTNWESNDQSEFLRGDLSFSREVNHAISVQATTTAATAGGNLSYAAGAGNTTGAGGTASVTGGIGGNDAAGGLASVTGGAAGGGNRAGGVSKVVGGAGAGTGTGGAGEVTGGAGGATGAGGNINITTGAGGATSGTSGILTAKSANETGTDSSGAVIMTSGTTVEAASGNAEVGTGNVSTSGNSGTAYLYSGSSAISGDSGEVYAFSGNAATGNTGPAGVTSGNSTVAGNSGFVELKSGTANTGDTGSATIATGNATTGTAGDVLITAGNGSVASGNVLITAGNGGTDGVVTVKTNGADRWTFNASGVLLPATDANNDIGNLAVNPRDIHASRQFIAKGVASTEGYGQWVMKYATASKTMAGGATEVIPVQVPAGSLLVAALLRNDSIVAGAGAATYSAAYSTGATQAISSGTAFAKNTKVKTFFNANGATAITSGATDITLTPDAGTLDSGTVTAVVFYMALVDLTDAA